MIRKLTLHNFDSMVNRPRIRPRILECRGVNSFIRVYSWTVFAFLATILLASCAAPTAQATVTAVPTSTRAAISISTETPAPIPAPTEDEQANTAEVADLLADLDYDASDHESFGSEFYTIETREWQGQQVRMLIHDDPSVEGQRIDGMEVMIDGELRWVRGLWYPTTAYPGSGGIVLDMPVSPGTDLATYFREENGPNSVYGQFLRAIAHQRGIAESQIWDYIVEHDYKIKIRLPNRANGSSYSPSLLTESELVEVDLSQPFYRSHRAEVNLGQAVNGVVLTDLPERVLFLIGDSRERSGWFVDAQGALVRVRFDYEGSMITGRAEYVSGDLFDQLEILAAMTDGFSDAGDFGPNQWLQKFFARVGASYRPGNTILDRDLFAKYNDAFTDYTWSLFTRK